MAIQGFRIISLEASAIYKQIQQNGENIGYNLPREKNEEFFYLFKNILDNSLDTMELEQAYTKIRRRKFSFKDERENDYTLAVINLKFNFTFKGESEVIELKELRKYFYEKGFNLGGVHYVRYKRSSGSFRC